MVEEVTLGQYSLPVLLSILLSIVYKFAPDNLADKWKVLISVGAGTLLGLLGLFYNDIPLTAKNIIDYLLYGAFSVGCAATGIHQIQRKVRE
jgi:hypothetical protein